MRIAITTRSQNDILYARMERFLPGDLPRIRYMGMNHWSDALTYLESILKLDYDYIVNVDEDCFITDWSKVLMHISIMQEHYCTHFGMPDSETFAKHRDNSDAVHNPFFNIFDVKKCREIIESHELMDDYEFGIDECFNDFFAKLNEDGKELIMYVNTHDDGLTTYTSFLLHTWYSRLYGHDPEQTARINARYNEALQCIS